MKTDLKSIALRARGVQHGPIVRLVSPDELGERLKPFVFLDFFNSEIFPGFGFGMHPHSGIATLTWQPGCDVRYEDTTGQKGTLKAGGLEWMNAGGGAWHQGYLMGSGPAIGFQLWVPMPPVLEDGPSIGRYIPPEQVASIKVAGGGVKVLLGALGDGEDSARSPINSHHDMNYLVVELEADALWRYEPPIAHDVAWAFAFEGKPLIQGIPTERELLVLEGSGAIDIAALKSPTRVLMGSAKRHAYPLVLGPSSIHTNRASLAKGLAQIERLGAALPRRA
jgi:redox-sensitive bicupin YhaK (pirin superfamily)